MPPLLREKERRGRKNSPVEEKRVLTQAAVRLAALIALILFIEFGIVTNKFIWYTALFLVPIKVFLFLTSIDVLGLIENSIAKLVRRALNQMDRSEGHDCATAK